MLGWFPRRLIGPRRSEGRRLPRGLRPGRPLEIKVVSVQDGDSLIVRLGRSRDAEETRVRLYAIDAPERDQQFGREAGDYLRRLVWNREDLLLEPVDTDQYGRLVGVLYYRAVGRRSSINRLMVGQGLAWWYRQFGGHGLGLEQAEREARRRRRGLWASARPIAPWEHRRAQRERAKGSGCLKWVALAAVMGAAVLAIAMCGEFA